MVPASGASKRQKKKKKNSRLDKPGVVSPYYTNFELRYR